jgi:DNA-binding protein HU-beta
MNKAQLIDALAERLGDKRVAAAAVAGLVDVVVRAVNAGDRVTITGFGVFEKRARAARTARNPRTGEAVIIQQTDVPAFRPGTLFREVISGTRALPPAGTAITAASANPAQPETSPPTSVPTTTAARRPATRVTAATHLTAVHLPTTKAPKAKAKAKAAKGEPKASLKIAAKAKGSAKSPAKGSEKKAGKKSLAKKSATKK